VRMPIVIANTKVWQGLADLKAGKSCLQCISAPIVERCRCALSDSCGRGVRGRAEVAAVE
jgi:hypothetical protein